MATRQARDRIDDLRRRLRAALEDMPKRRTTGAGNVNRSARTNVVVSRNVGQEGSTHSAVSVQAAPTRQKGSDSRAPGGQP